MRPFIRMMVLLIAGILPAVASTAQTVRGTVKDSSGKIVPYATVNLKKATEAAILAFTQTDGKGGFVLKIPSDVGNEGLSVEVRSLGYQTAVKQITSFDAPLDFTLGNMFNELQGVVVQSERPVLRSHGDTIGYKVSEFARPQDRVIADVLKNMPGISVANDGTISFNNKPVSAVYIGGDNLLDDKYSIATNNIPHGVVNQVQVIQNSQPIKMLQSKLMSEDVALNLDIKKNAKLQMIGQESIGAGLPGKYDVDLNAMMFKDKYKAINYFKTNNTGYDLQQELVSHNLGSYQQRIDNAVPAALLSNGSVNNPSLSTSRYLFNQASAINLNNLVNFKNSLQLKLNASYLHDSQQQDYQQQTHIFLPGDTVTYKETQHNRFIPDLFHTQLTLNINREKYYLNDVLLMDINNSSRYSQLQTDSSSVNQLLTDMALNFSNELNLIRALSSKHIIQAYSYISHSAEPEHRVINPGYNTAIFNNNMPYAQLVQQADVPSWYTNNYIAFRIPSNWLTQTIRTGFSVQSQMLSSDLSVVQNNNSIALKDSSHNRLNWTKQKAYAEASFDLPGTILKATLVLPLTLQQLNYSDQGFALNQSMKRVYFNPQVNLKYQYNVKDYISFAYSYRNQIGTIENVYPGLILTDYRTLAANSGHLTEQSTQQVSGGFSHSKTLTLFFWSVGAVYSHTQANAISSSVITNNIQKGIVLLYPNSTDSWVVNGSVSKYLFPLRTTLTGSVQWQSNHSVQIQNNVLLPFNTDLRILSMSTETKLSSNLSLGYKGSWMQTKSRSSVESSGHQFDQLLQQASINYDPFNRLQFRLSGDHYFTRQLGNPDLSYFFGDAGVKFKLNQWRTDVELSAVNFLDLRSYSAVYLTANTFVNSSYSLPGRVLLVKVFFRL